MSATTFDFRSEFPYRHECDDKWFGMAFPGTFRCLKCGASGQFPDVRNLQ